MMNLTDLSLKELKEKGVYMMNLTDLSLKELKELLNGMVDDRLCELLGDPDPGLPLDETVRARLKQSLASSDRVTGEEIAEKLEISVNTSKSQFSRARQLLKKIIIEKELL